MCVVYDSRCMCVVICDSGCMYVWLFVNCDSVCMCVLMFVIVDVCVLFVIVDVCVCGCL